MTVPTTSSRWLPVLRGALIVLVTLLLYLPVYRAGFIWDDEEMLTANPSIRASSGLLDIWFTTKFQDYFPLTYTSFWLEWRLWGMNASGYHVTNALLHALGTVLLWRVLLRLKIPGAWLAALVFGVHPVCVASAAWISERKNTLSLVFYLLSILWYLRFDGASRQRSPGVGKWYGFSLVAFLLALLSKTSVVILPIVLWLCVWWQHSRAGRVPGAGRRGLAARTNAVAATPRPPALDPRLLFRLAPFLALAVILGLVTVWFQLHPPRGGDVIYRSDPWSVRLISGSWAVWFYLWKALLPVKLGIIYPRWEVNPVSVVSYLPGLLWLAGLFWCWSQRQGWGRAPFFGLAYFWVALWPVLGVFDMRLLTHTRAADHWQYLALPGVIALGVGVAASRLTAQRWVSRLAGGAVVVVLSVLTSLQASLYAQPEALWHQALVRSPKSPTALVNLGIVLDSQNKFAEAEPYYREAVRLRPDLSVGQNNLGYVLLNQRRLKEAVPCFLKAMQLQPDFAEPHFNLAVVYHLQGKPDQAIAQLRVALRLKPDYALARNNLAAALLDQGRFAEALQHLQQVVRSSPGLASAHNNLGKAWLALGQSAKAREAFAISLRLQPGQPDVLVNLGGLLFQQGRFADAVGYFQAALRLKPDYPTAHQSLGLALSALGRTNDAIAEFAETLKLKPDAAVAHYQLGVLLAGRQRVEEAIGHLREAVRLQPGSSEACNRLAWILATHPDGQYRNGTEAVEVAERAVELTQHKDASALDTLAAAYAEAGRFDEAVRTAQQAMAVATAAGNKELAGHIETRLKWYQAGRPWRQP